MSTPDPRDQRIAELEARVAQLEGLLTAALARIVELEAKLGESSKNSSRPPSSDPPGIQRPSKPPSGRKPGGQPGHQRSSRPLVPAGRVDRHVEYRPQQCDGCERSLLEASDHAEPTRHQVAELPEIRAEVTEHRCYSKMCVCGRVTTASLPSDVPRGSFGPRLLAALALMSGRYRKSRREVVAIFETLFRIELSVGMVDKACMLAGELMRPAVEEVADAVSNASIANADETGFRCAGMKGWLWVAVCSGVTLFRLVPGRGGHFARKLLGDFRGVLGTDRWGGYAWFEAGPRQLCWAHLKRNLQGLVDGRGDGQPFGRRGLELIKEMFELWHRHKHTDDRQAFDDAMTPLQASWHRLIARHRASPCAKTRGLVRDMTEYWSALWAFVKRPGVEPTNNAAERAIRPAVLWRKGSFGTQSDAGARFVEGILTVSATCAQRERSVYDFLVSLFAAHQAGAPSPKLLIGP